MARTLGIGKQDFEKVRKENAFYITLKIHRRLGGLSSGIPSAPSRLSFMVVHSLVGA